MIRPVLLPLLFCAVPVGALVAQGPPPGGPRVIMIVPYGGINLPGKTLLKDSPTRGGYDAALGYVVGLRLQVPVAARLDAVADIGYASGPVHGYGPVYTGLDGTANFVSFTGRVAYRFTPARSRVSLAVNGGGGIMQHWISSPNARYENWPTAVTGVQVGVPLMRRVRAILGAESFWYTAKIGSTDQISTGQQDFRFTVGLTGEE